MKINFTYSVIIFFVALVIGGVVAKTIQKNGPGEYDDFAACLTDNGAIMYGADWCHNCQNQKAMFGNSFKKINYVECDLNKETCDEEGIEGYPTWKNHANGGDVLVGRGVQKLQDLANAFSCELPTAQ